MGRKLTNHVICDILDDKNRIVTCYLPVQGLCICLFVSVLWKSPQKRLHPCVHETLLICTTHINENIFHFVMCLRIFNNSNFLFNFTCNLTFS